MSNSVSLKTGLSTASWVASTLYCKAYLQLVGDKWVWKRFSQILEWTLRKTILSIRIEKTSSNSKIWWITILSAIGTGSNIFSSNGMFNSWHNKACWELLTLKVNSMSQSRIWWEWSIWKKAPSTATETSISSTSDSPPTTKTNSSE